MRAWLSLIVVIFAVFAAACAPSTPEIPTLAILPSATPYTLLTIPPTRTPVPVFTATFAPPTESIATSIVAADLIPVVVGSLNVADAPGISLRADPLPDALIVVTVSGGSVVHAQRRTADSNWIEIVTDQGQTGWVAARDVFAVADLASLPYVGEPQATVVALAPGVIPTPTLTITPTQIIAPTPVTLGDVPAMEQRLRETPILLNLTSERTRWLVGRGRDFGLRSNVFTTVGDSNTTNGDFLQPIGMGVDTYCNFADYAYLNATVAYFSAAPSEDSSNSFVHHSVAAQKGFSSASVLDPFWAGGDCRGSESPLMCEYRLIQPSIAVIMLGGIDVTDMTTADYTANMHAVVTASIRAGVIPVLTTFVVLPDRGAVYERSLEFNLALVDIATAEDTPLINLWAAAQSLPDDGIGPDHTHLKAQVGSFCAFDGAQTQLGGTLRNLLTLQALDVLRANLLAP